jgi:hypothetical protein
MGANIIVKVVAAPPDAPTQPAKPEAPTRTIPAPDAPVRHPAPTPLPPPGRRPDGPPITPITPIPGICPMKEESDIDWLEASLF